MTRLFVEHLTTLDCGVLDRQRGLVGVTWLADVALQGAPDDSGMILDFGPAKRLIKNRIDALIDHRLLVPADAPGLKCRAPGELTFTDDVGGRVDYRGPADSVCVLPGTDVSPQAAGRRIEADLAKRLPDNVTGVTVTLHAESIDGAHYAYCHGLKRHGGHCQRIGHGHRSRLEIAVDGQRSPRHERRWCERWRDVFLGNRADLVSDPAEPRYRFAYDADEGRFELELDARRCELIDGDATVENIAAFIAGELKREQPGAHVRVRAYEGVHKGAEAEA